MDTESKCSSHLTKLFLARATARADFNMNKLRFSIFKDVHYKSKNLAEESRYTISLIHVRVALICYCGKR